LGCWRRKCIFVRDLRKIRRIWKRHVSYLDPMIWPSSR
jgi:hypothetical protein